MLQDLIHPGQSMGRRALRSRKTYSEKQPKFWPPSTRVEHSIKSTFRSAFTCLQLMFLLLVPSSLNQPDSFFILNLMRYEACKLCSLLLAADGIGDANSQCGAAE